MLKEIVIELFSAGAEEAGSNTGAIIAAGAVGAAAGAGTAYLLMRRQKADATDVKALIEGSKWDRDLLAEPLLAEALGVQTVQLGVPARAKLLKALVEIAKEHGPATVNVVLATIVRLPNFVETVGANPTAAVLLDLAAATLKPFVGVTDVTKIDEAILKSENPRDKALVDALKKCFEKKHFVNVPSDQPAVAAA